MIKQGFSKPLQHSDLWRLHQDERSRALIKNFNVHWKEQKKLEEYVDSDASEAQIFSCLQRRPNRMKQPTFVLS
jgi:hypothetical protein